MNKILALACLLAVAPAFAAQNTFTFEVNSSGADIYVCGFELSNHRAVSDVDHPPVTGSPYTSFSYATWTEETVDAWDNKVLEDKSVDVTEMLSDHNGKISRNFSAQLLGSLEEYKRINNLTFFLNDETFNNTFLVKVCYNVPLYMDISKVNFDVTMKSHFENLTDQGRDYLNKAGILADLSIHPSISNGLKLSPNGFAHTQNTHENGNLTYKEVMSFLNSEILVPQNEGVIVAEYKYHETSNARRPHLKHGGHFTVDTIVTPVAK